VGINNALKFTRQEKPCFFQRARLEVIIRDGSFNLHQHAPLNTHKQFGREQTHCALSAADVAAIAPARKFRTNKKHCDIDPGGVVATKNPHSFSVWMKTKQQVGWERERERESESSGAPSMFIRELHRFTAAALLL
jgi:hypothetical protein